MDEKAKNVRENTKKKAKKAPTKGQFQVLKTEEGLMNRFKTSDENGKDKQGDDGGADVK